MYFSLTSILLTLGAKCLLNCILVLFQKHCITKSFLGVFSISLAVVDAALTSAVSLLHSSNDGFISVFGYQLSNYHTCLLVQIIGEIHRVMQWPVVIMAALDHFYSVPRRSNLASVRINCCVYLIVTAFLWSSAALYIFWFSGFTPIMENIPQYLIDRCWVFSSSRMLHISLLLLFILGCVALNASHKQPPDNSLKIKTVEQNQNFSPGRFFPQAMFEFLQTWTAFLLILAVLFLMSTEIPSYLDLNVAWLCFFNSLLIALVLCATCPASQPPHGEVEVPSDNFCECKT